MSLSKQYTADFYCFTKAGKRSSPHFHTFLKNHVGRHGPSLELEKGDKDQYQIRSISSNTAGTIFMAVFGRCRYGETPEQANEHTDESDVSLLPGHGLVEKNHFLFYPDLNLLVFQRNGSASTPVKLQRYLNLPQYQQITLEPVLTRDSYKRLEEGGPMKKLEVSILRPTLEPAPGEEFIGDAIKMFKTAEAGSMKVTLSADRGRTLSESLRVPLATLARQGRTRVARAYLEEENEVEVVDLIAERIRESFEVPLQANGRPLALDVFRGLARAKQARASDLRAFFG